MWKVEDRNAASTPTYPIANGVSVEDWPFLINIPSPPFAFGSVGALVCKGKNAEYRAGVMAAAPDLLMACKSALYLLEAVDHPGAGAVALQLTQAILKAEEPKA